LLKCARIGTKAYANRSLCRNPAALLSRKSAVGHAKSFILSSSLILTTASE
jgi:hypothetical protein